MASGRCSLTAPARTGVVPRRAAVGVLAAAAIAVLAAPGCDEQANADTASIKIGGRWFHLELALDEEKRTKGLGGRDHIDEDGGMLFVFPEARPLQFVMRDCTVPIDILFLDATGRVVAMHTMLVEEPRRPDEPAPADPRRDPDPYEARLKRYSSRYSAQFAVELKGHTLPGLKVKEGDRLDFDVEGLKRRAR